MHLHIFLLLLLNHHHQTNTHLLCLHHNLLNLWLLPQAFLLISLYLQNPNYYFHLIILSFENSWLLLLTCFHFWFPHCFILIPFQWYSHSDHILVPINLVITLAFCLIFISLFQKLKYQNHLNQTFYFTFIFYPENSHYFIFKCLKKEKHHLNPKSLAYFEVRSLKVMIQVIL